MRELSKLRGVAVAVVLFASAAFPVAAENIRLAGDRTGPTPVFSVTPVFLYAPDVVRVQVECAPTGQSWRFLEWWRQTWGVGMTQRATRPEDDAAERVTGTSYYLRSPLLSGFYGRNPEPADCPGGGAASRPVEDEPCALVLLRHGERDRIKRFEVRLPQLDARNARQLGSHIQARLDNGDAVVLLRSDGSAFSVKPGRFREITTESCGMRRTE